MQGGAPGSAGSVTAWLTSAVTLRAPHPPQQGGWCFPGLPQSADVPYIVLTPTVGAEDTGKLPAMARTRPGTVPRSLLSLWVGASASVMTRPRVRQVQNAIGSRRARAAWQAGEQQLLLPLSREAVDANSQE